MAAKDVFTIEVIVPGAEPIVGQATLDDARSLRWDDPRPGEDEWKSLGNVIYRNLFDRVTKGTGQLLLRDLKGRHWIIPATSIVAVGFTDPRERAGAGTFGFGGDEKGAPSNG